MTLEGWKERFAAWQKKENAEWYLDSLDSMRTYYNVKHGRCCPLTAEFGAGAGYYNRAGNKLNLGMNDVGDIVDAADKGKEHDPELRAWLLRVCGVKEAA